MDRKYLGLVVDDVAVFDDDLRDDSDDSLVCFTGDKPFSFVEALDDMAKSKLHFITF